MKRKKTPNLNPGNRFFFLKSQTLWWPKYSTAAPQEAGKQPAGNPLSQLLPAAHPQHLHSLPHLTMCLQGQHSESSRLPTPVDPLRSAQTLLLSPSPAVRSSCLASQVFVPTRTYSFLWVPRRSPSALDTLSVLANYLMLNKCIGPRKAPPRGESGKATESHRGTKAPCHSGGSRRFTRACTEPSPSDVRPSGPRGLPRRQSRARWRWVSTEKPHRANQARLGPASEVQLQLRAISSRSHPPA